MRSPTGSRPLCQDPSDLLATDTHCHLERFRRPAEVLARAKAARVRVIAVTSRPSDFRTLFPLYGRREGVRLALGLHPLEVGKVDVASELRLFERYAEHTSYLGEIGLDLSAAGRETSDDQHRALESILSIGDVRKKVMTVHSRGAGRQVLDALVAARATRVIMHWFTGALSDLDRVLDAGFSFSINPAMTRTVKGRKLIDRIPRERVLVETDGPYVKVGINIAEPRDVWVVINDLAAAWSLTPSEAARLIEGNLRQLVGATDLRSPDT
jgi:TatD DNase family protein